MKQNFNVDLSNVDNIKCNECDNETFVPAFIIKQVSALMSPTGKETLVPIQLFKCSKCNHVNEKFLEGLTN
tara:strand:+ start:49 stop:261 length:213 start_codon:yes stop_codon:yes gene_type:complete